MLTCLLVKTLPGAPSSSGLVRSVLKQYLQDMQRNRASKSTVPAAQYGCPCTIHYSCCRPARSGQGLLLLEKAWQKQPSTVISYLCLQYLVAFLGDLWHPHLHSMARILGIISKMHCAELIFVQCDGALTRNRMQQQKHYAVAARDYAILLKITFKYPACCDTEHQPHSASRTWHKDPGEILASSSLS